LGLSFFSDRQGDFGRPLEEVYLNAMPLLDPFVITDEMVDSAFEYINTMFGGGDSPEGNII